MTKYTKIQCISIKHILTDHLNQYRFPFSSSQLMVLGKFHHPGHDVRVKVRFRPAAPKSFVSSCGSNQPFNYCGTMREAATFGFTHDKQIAGSLRRCMHACVCVCVWRRESVCCCIKGQKVCMNVLTVFQFKRVCACVNPVVVVFRNRQLQGNRILPETPLAQ